MNSIYKDIFNAVHKMLIADGLHLEHTYYVNLMYMAVIKNSL